MRILVVEDYSALRRNVTEFLTESGYVVDSTGDGEEGLWYAQNHVYDVLVLDIMLPGLDGIELIRRLNQKGPQVPVIIISARDSVENRIEGLDAGANDYLVKPFALDELLARIRVQTRQQYDTKAKGIRVGDLELNVAGRRVTRGGEEITLTRREYHLLEYLVHRAGEIVTRNEIWDHAFENYEGGSSNNVDVYIGYLRKKLNDQGRENLIHTRRGQGYYMEGGESEESLGS